MSVTHAQLMRFTDAELLHHLDDRRAHSPVIDELCKRLEPGAFTEVKQINHQVECPICMAGLEADFDDGNAMFTIKVAP